MAIKVPKEAEVLHEATEVLLRHMSPSRVARLLTAWQVGSGDYREIRGRLFEGETVESVAEKVHAFERENPETPSWT
jgi:hypothetical protein